MSKSINFVYEWIGPNGPITNNRLPTIADLSHAQYANKQGDFVQDPFFYQMFDHCKIVPACKIPKGKFLYEMNFSPWHYRDWSRLFHDATFQSIRNLEVKQAIAEGRGYLAITIPFEGWVHDKMFNAIHSHFESIGFPMNQLIYVSNCTNGQEMYYNYCQRTGKEPSINVEYIPTCRIHKTGIEEPVQNPPEYKTGLKEKDFLCFQRRYNDCRLIFFMSMWKKNLLDKFYMSMAKEQPEAGRSFESNMQHVANRYPLFEISKKDIEESEKVLPLVLDSNNFNVYPMEKSANDVAYYYENSLVNIISETNFFNNEIHLNEKTYKPIAFKQPFIMMGAPKSLQHVKDMGFKTFDKWWNEDYDLIHNHVERMKAIVNIVEQISQWTNEQKIKFTYEVKDIVDYNANHLVNMENKEITIFEEKYGN